MIRSTWTVLLPTALLLLAWAVPPTVVARDIILDQNGRYNDALVALSEDIAEDWSLVDKLKSAFQEASRRLAVASRINGSRSFAFGHVYILVPRSWSNSSVDQPATWHTEEAAHFRVSQRGNPIPNTVQPGDCGRPGLHVRLHRQHLIDSSAADLGKQLVHEFAHLRWGVFDEYNGAAGPQAYLHEGRLIPVRCAETITGRFGHKDTGSPCRVDRNTLQLEPDCRYITDAGQTAQGSLMYATYMDSVRQFCTPRRGNPDLDHNAVAPNPHNRRCGGRSVQSVMEEHADYKRSIDGRETDLTVNFTVVQPQRARRLVIVMDVSGSMRGEPLAKMKIAVRTLLLGLLEDGIECAMVSFSNVINMLRDLNALNSDADRRAYWQIVARLSANGATAIGDALARAMELLGADMRQPSKADTGYILLLTDGQENAAQRFSFAQAARIAQQTSIVVDTVAFGNQADKQLADLSANTGGKAYFVRFQSPANDLMEAMSDMVRERVPASQKPVDVFSSPVNAGFIQKVNIDNSVSNSAQFTLSSPVLNDIRNNDLEVVSPSGAVYSKLNGSAYIRDNDSGVITISTTGKVEVGEWTIRGVTAFSPAQRRRRRSAPAPITEEEAPRAKSSEPANGRLSLVVTSRPTDQAPIILDGSVSEAKLVLTADSRLAVFATLEQGGSPVEGAEIVASVESDSGLGVEINLRDDGVGADATKGDGVHSGFVPHTLNVVQEYNVRLTTTKPVSRVSTAGKFEITRVDHNSLRRTPPAQVTDLQAHISLDSGSVSLEWTAVGAQQMQGNVTLYILSVCYGPNELDACSLTSLTTPEQAPGTSLTVSVPPHILANNTMITLYLSVAAENSAGYRGTASNTVSVQMRLPDNLDEIERSGGLSTVAIVLIALGTVLAVGLIVGVIVFFIVKKQPSGRKV